MTVALVCVPPTRKCISASGQPQAADFFHRLIGKGSLPYPWVLSMFVSIRRARIAGWAPSI